MKKFLMAGAAVLFTVGAAPSVQVQLLSRVVGQMYPLNT